MDSFQHKRIFYIPFSQGTQTFSQKKIQILMQSFVFCASFHAGKTRTREKYRVVYTDHQRLELEKEFHYNRYITIRRKSELAANLRLSERQVAFRHCALGFLSDKKVAKYFVMGQNMGPCFSGCQVSPTMTVYSASRH